MDILAKLFGSLARVKLLRLFLFNSETVFSLKEITRRSRLTPASARKEIRVFEQIGLTKTVKESSAPRVKHWRLNPKFVLTRQLRYLLDADFKDQRQEISQRFRDCGRIKLLIIAGALIGDEHGRADLVLVGDNLRRPLVEQAIKGLEADLGRELVYALLETHDFNYRLSASDKFIRDLLEYPHERLVNKLGI